MLRQLKWVEPWTPYPAQHRCVVEGTPEEQSHTRQRRKLLPAIKCGIDKAGGLVNSDLSVGLCWTARGSCKCCKHLLAGLTLLSWMNLVGRLLWYPMESTMNVCVSCALESTVLGLLCNYHHMDWNKIVYGVLFRVRVILFGQSWVDLGRHQQEQYELQFLVDPEMVELEEVSGSHACFNEELRVWIQGKLPFVACDIAKVGRHVQDWMTKHVRVNSSEDEGARLWVTL